MSLIDKIFSVSVLKYLKDFRISKSKTNTIGYLERALTWFRTSFDRQELPASAYSMVYNSFMPPSAEVCAHWLSDLIQLKKFHNNIFTEKFSDQAITSIVQWLLKVQRPDGSWPSGNSDYTNQPPSVFTSAIVINALLNYYREHDESEVLNAINKCSDWILHMQSQNGNWEYYAFNESYSLTFAAAILIRSGKLLNNENLIHSGIKNIDYILSFQNTSGYFENGDQKKSFHLTSSYVWMLMGIIEAGLELKNSSYIHAAEKGARHLLEKVNPEGFVYGEVESNFESTANYCSMYGNCLISLLCFNFYENSDNQYYLDNGLKTLEYIKKRQLKSKMPFLHGGVTGSWPVSGRYKAYEIPGEAVAMFVKALMKEHFITEEKTKHLSGIIV